MELVRPGLGYTFFARGASSPEVVVEPGGRDELLARSMRSRWCSQSCSWAARALRAAQQPRSQTSCRMRQEPEQRANSPAYDVAGIATPRISGKAFSAARRRGRTLTLLLTFGSAYRTAAAVGEEGCAQVGADGDDLRRCESRRRNGPTSRSLPRRRAARRRRT